MARSLNDYDYIAIAEIVVYSFFLIGGVLLCIKHGAGKSAGWRFLVILSLTRLIGSSMLLATVNDPSNENLYIGWMVLNGLGFGPLVLTLLGLLSRLFDSINRHNEVVKPLYQRLIQLLMLAAMILLIIGGTNANYLLDGDSPHITYNSESKAGAGIMIAVTALLLLQTLIAFLNQGYIAQGEHRIMLAIIASLPFVIVRLAYTCVIILGGKVASVWLYLGAGVIMEIMVAIICEAVGFTLDKAAPKAPKMQSDQEFRNNVV